MKPVSLTIKGFRSHEDTTELSFAGRRLFAIVGPTGAGKSSILDAVSYALYGATPRIRRNVKKLICTRSDSAHVRFVFEVEGREVEITRSLRRSGPGEHVLVDGAAGGRVIGDSKVTERVTQLLGLDFDAFCSSVLLAQGRFAKFLEAPPTERSQILKGVFRLDQIDALREKAKERRNELEGDLKRVEGRRAHIPDDVAALVEEAAAAHAACSARVRVLEKALPGERKLLDAAERSAEGLAAAEAALKSARDALAAAPSPGDLRTLAANEAEVAEPLAVAAAAAAAATAAREEASSELAGLEEQLGAHSALIEARVKARTVAEATALLGAHTAAAGAAEKRVEATATALAEAEAFEQGALENLEKIRAEREDIERAHQAHVLREALVVGEPCPVCEQDVPALPKGRKPRALTGSRKAEKDAAAAHAEAVKATRDAATAAASAERDLAAARARLDDERTKLQSARAALDELVGDVAEPLAEVERRLTLVAAARDALTAAGDELERARGELARWTEAKTAVTKVAHKLVAQLSHVAGALALAPPSHDAAISDLVDEAGTILAAARSAVEEAEAAAATARAAEAEARGALASLRTSLDLDPRTSVDAALREAIRTATEAEGRERSLREMVAESAKLDEQEKQLRATLGLYVQLADDMTDRNFIKFMLEEKRRLLSDIGSERLREMTRRYRFDDRGEFNVVDELDADKERTVDTLSGGEIFLASLALSLALAEAVTRHGGRLQCFFLDEGFGSLDPEALDSALEGIEHIVTEDRLIGLVSHVEALRNRIEDKIVLDKDDDGMTRVIVGSTLG
ncbi:MAG TPA: SMC family ATPase [Actinomycetota bacterium]|nr:SMC family ATPase [Actinomycetota bacterium]